METIITVKPPKQVIALPHYLLVNGQLLGIIKDQPVRLILPPDGATVALTVRSLYKFIEGSATITARPSHQLVATFTDHERWWNLLFTIDLVLWLVKLFVSLPLPWHLVYDFVSNGFFAIWIIRLIIIRKRYFHWSTTPASEAQTTPATEAHSTTPQLHNFTTQTPVQTK